MTPIIPFSPPRLPAPEPEAIIKFGDIEIRIGLTFLHHLNTCGGWSDRECTVTAYRDGDAVMADAMVQIERAMYAVTDAQRADRVAKGQPYPWPTDGGKA